MYFSRLKLKKQLTCQALSLALAFSFLPAYPLTVSAEGSLLGQGTSEAPFQISSEADLAAFRDLINKGNSDISGVLTQNITITDTWTPIGDYNNGLTYTGTFQGNGHTITITATDSNQNYQGLFGYNGGTIEGLTVTGTVSGTEYAGGIAAVNKGSIIDSVNLANVTTNKPVSFAGGITGINYSTISDTENQGNITSTSAGSCAGGIAGASPSGSISASVNTGTISGEAANVEEEYRESCVGGIVGLNYDSEILTSSNSGAVTSTDTDSYVGGVAGLNNGSVTDSFNSGSIAGPNYAGGIAGYLFKNEKIERQPSVKNTLNTGVIHTENTSYYGSIYGGNQGGSSYNNYYKTTTPGNDNPDALGVTAEELSSGQVTYQLNENTSDEFNQWRQNLASDSLPVLTAGSPIVYAVFGNDGIITGYTNDKDQGHTHTFDDNGVCSECHYESLALKGHSLTLDGAIGANYYYYIDPMYLNGDYDIKVVFTANTSKVTASFDPDFSILSDGKTKLYGFKVYAYANYLSVPMNAQLQITKKDNSQSYTLLNENYQIYDYLKELWGNESSSKELKDLVQTLATYDYYATKRFEPADKVLPEDIPLNPIATITTDTLKPYESFVQPEDGYPVKHYANTLLFQSSTRMRLYLSLADKSLDAKNLVMGYKIHDGSDNYSYVSLKQDKNGYYGDTAKIPASQLDQFYDIAFFQKNEDASYQQVSAIKTMCPYSYVYSVLKLGGSNPANQDVSKALYLYGEASKAYFDSQESLK